jgi:deazaflavin-dependent oxidoreductase (nitroreductase family)
MKMSPWQEQLVRWISQAHVAAYRFSGGWGPLNRNTLILTTRGRKTGREISKPLLYFEEQGRVYIVASYGGSDEPPAWYLNLLKNPQVRAEIGSKSATYRGRPLSPEQARPIWPRLLAIYPTYAEYQKKTSRTIPIVELVPAAE